MWQMVWLPLTARELWSLTNPAKFYCFFTQKASCMMILMETMFCWMQPTNLYSLTLVKKAKARILKPKVDIKEVCKRYSHIAPELHRGDRQCLFFWCYGSTCLKGWKLRELRKSVFHSLLENAHKLKDALKELVILATCQKCWKT